MRKIIDYKWLGEANTSNNQTTRTAKYTVQRHVKNYTEICSGTFTFVVFNRDKRSGTGMTIRFAE